MIANAFAGTIMAQIPKIDNVSEKTSNTRIYDENNIHDTYMIMDNYPPIMDWIKGPTIIKAFSPGKWEFHAYDNDSMIVLFIADWGDGTSTTTQWYGCAGGEVYGSAAHTYLTAGDMIIKVRAQDGQGGVSQDVTYPITVKTKDKSINTSFLQFLLKFIQDYPNLFPILQRML
jgi:hypothetical protein